jgi:uncharacterized protein (DUF488 family)
MEFFTIGVYNSFEQDFFDKLKENNIDTFCDIRQRRGVRGSKYSFVNSTKLQDKLKSLGIKYVYVSDLAPTKEIRELQKKVDIAKGELKSERQTLGEVFVSEYKETILKKFDFANLFEELNRINANRIVLFCVEEQPMACHRSIVASELVNKFHFKINNL